MLRCCYLVAESELAEMGSVNGWNWSSFPFAKKKGNGDRLYILHKEEGHLFDFCVSIQKLMPALRGFNSPLYVVC